MKGGHDMVKRITSLTDEETYLLLGDYFRQYVNDYKNKSIGEFKKALQQDWILEYFDHKNEIIDEILDMRRKQI